MFEESPFSGVCVWATYEVCVMLAGTFLLGVLLGYLIWGWLKGRVATLEKDLKAAASMANARQLTIASLLSRTHSLEEEKERAETKVTLAEYRMRKAQEELSAMQQQIGEETDGPGEVDQKAAWSGDEPSLADITMAMEMPPAFDISDSVGSGQSLANTESEMEDVASAGLMRGTSPESLEVAAQIFGSRVAVNDLKIIHGIGPKIEEILHRAGVDGWAALSRIRLPDLRGILEEAGPRYRLFDPKTWPVQARMAAKGEWRKLRAYQETLSEQGE